MAWVTAAKELPAWAEIEVDLPALRGREANTDEVIAGEDGNQARFRIDADKQVASNFQVAHTVADSPQVVAPSLSELFVVKPLPSEQPSSAEERVMIFIVKSQSADNFSNMACSQVTIQVDVVHDSATQPSERESMTLLVEVPGYDIERDGPFRQMQICASGRGVLLVAPRCCAGVVVPAIDDPDAASEAQLRAAPMVPPAGLEIVKVQWHPLSDAHIAMLLSDNTWQLLNIAHRVAVDQPEVLIKVKFDGECEAGERCSDFSFGLPSALASHSSSRSEAVWLAVTVFFLSNQGKVSFCSPILPSLSVFPTAMLDALRTSSDGAHDEVPGSRIDGYEWLSRTLLCTANRRSVPLPGAQPDTYHSIRHALHLHGDSESYFRRWTPSEQYVAEPRTESDASPRSPRSPKSPRHHHGKYCSIQIVSHFPVVVVARATTTGLVEFLILSGAISPEFERRDFRGKPKMESLSCVAFEEVDLALNPQKTNAVQLSMVPSAESSATILLARSRTLVAAIEVPWIASLRASDVEVLPSATITTLMEIRAADGPCEFVGWQLVHARKDGCLGLALRMQEGASKGRGSLQSVDVEQSIAGVPKARGSKESTASSNGKSSGVTLETPERKEYMRYFAPMVTPAQLFGSAGSDGPELPKASVVASKVTSVQEGQVAALAAKQEVLKDLATQAPERMRVAMAEISDLRKTGEELRKRTESTNRHVETIRERQAKLDEKYKALTEALNAQLELHALDHTAAEELPRLWSQLHELRQAFELLRAAAAPQNPHEMASQSANWLRKVEKLQHTWTQSTADSLREQAVEAEKLVASTAVRLGHPGNLGIVN